MFVIFSLFFSRFCFNFILSLNLILVYDLLFNLNLNLSLSKLLRFRYDLPYEPGSFFRRQIVPFPAIPGNNLRICSCHTLFKDKECGFFELDKPVYPFEPHHVSIFDNEVAVFLADIHTSQDRLQR